MTISELQEQVKEDTKIDKSELGSESSRIPDIHWKYSKLLMAETAHLKKLEREQSVVYLKLWEYYKKKADPEIYRDKPLLKTIMDSNVKMYIAADPEMQELQAKIDNKTELLNFIKRTLDSISQRGWTIKNILDDLKFKNGGSFA